MKRVVLDTNVYISALAFSGKPLELLIWAEVGLFELSISKEILYEVHAKLSDKFGWNKKQVDEAIYKILNVASLISPKNRIVACSDPDDDKILECAIAAGADYVISGDKKHLLIMKEFRGVQIVTVANFLSSLP